MTERGDTDRPGRDADGDAGLRTSTGTAQPDDQGSGAPVGAAPATGADADPTTARHPEESISQPWSRTRAVGGAQQAALRAAYGPLRAAIKARPGRFRTYQRRLKQARIRGTYDVYLATSIRMAIGAAGLGALGGLFVTLAIATSPVPFSVFKPVFAMPGTSFGLFAAYPGLTTASVLATVGAVGAGGGVLLYRLYRPHRRIRARRRSINQNLPYAVMFMYALSRGGMNFLDVCRRLADAGNMYGEVANEFDMVVREVDLFGNDLHQALSNVETLTPSDEFQRFLDDLLSVLESGGDLETFLQAETEKSLETAHEEQERFIETVGTLSELFVVAFVAAPLLLIVVLMVVSFLGAETVGIIQVLVYVVFPLGMVGFLVAIDTLSGPSTAPTTGTDPGRTVTADQAAADRRFPVYQEASRRTSLRAILSRHADGVRHNPERSLWHTVPAAIIVNGAVIATGLAQPTVDAFVATPVWTTSWLVVVPLLTAAVPLMLLHERERRRRRTIAQRLPDVLNILSNANQMGVELVDACELVTRWSSGVLVEEFEKVRNDLAWNHDIRRALLAFADRMNVPQLTRSMTLIAQGSRASGDLHSLLDIAAADTRARAKLEAARRQSVNAYVTIVIIGFLVYLLVIVMVSTSYLGPISELSAGAGTPDRPEALAGIGTAPVEIYRMLFLHSALIQGFGSGLIAGKLADDDVKSGLRYGIAMVLTTIAAFVLFV